MSGGAIEFTAGYFYSAYDRPVTFGKFLIEETDLRYKQIYSGKYEDTNGDAIFETRPAMTGTGWYSDSSSYLDSRHAFFSRGSHYSGRSSGLFELNRGEGDGSGGAHSFRVVLVAL